MECERPNTALFRYGPLIDRAARLIPTQSSRNIDVRRFTPLRKIDAKSEEGKFVVKDQQLDSRLRNFVLGVTTMWITMFVCLGLAEIILRFLPSRQDFTPNQ